MINSNYDIHLRANVRFKCKIYCDLNGNKLEKYASIYVNID